MTYRPHIDGLRALAILSVLGYHARIPGFSGGFLGVDMFFVISGFLMTSILIPQFIDQTFTWREYLYRRWKRIVPPLIPVIAVSTFLAFLTLPTNLMKDFSQSVVATALSASNVLFFLEQDYFNPGALNKPLLHTWSLGVEVQFYLLFPLLLFAMGKRLQRFSGQAFIASLALISLIASEFTLSINSSAAYFLVPFRLWEFLSGALVAGMGSVRAPFLRSGTVRFALMALLLGSVFLFEPSSPHPGFLTVIPVFATAVLLLEKRGSSDLTSRFLESSPMRLIGQSSYETYLWHYPLLVFLIAVKVIDLASVSALLLMIGSLLVGYAAHFLRNWGTSRRSRRKSFELAASAVVLVGFLTVGLGGHLTNGYSARFPDALSARDIGWIADCQGEALCSLDSPESERTILLVGDSHAMHLGGGMREILGHEFDIDIVASGSCLFVNPEESDVEIDSTAICSQQQELVRQIPPNSYDFVVYSQRWTGYPIQQVFSGSEPDQTIGLFDSVARKALVIVGEMPTQQTHCRQTEFLLDTNLDCAGNNSGEIRSVEDQYFADQLDKKQFISLAELFCDVESCNYSLAGRSIYFDDHHLSRSGSKWVARTILSSIH